MEDEIQKKAPLTISEAKSITKEAFMKSLIEDGDGNVHHVQWLQGEAAKQHNNQPVGISGTITAISRFLDYREGEFYPKTAHCLASKTDGKMKLIVNEHTVSDKYTVEGSIQIGKKFIELGVNNFEESKTPLQMVDMLKMRRSLFKNRSEYTNLLAKLGNVKAKIDRDMEQFKDDRANHYFNFKQTVTSNIPEEFNLNLPLIEGEDPVEVPVRVTLEADVHSINCYLESIDAADLIEAAFENLILEEVEKIKDKVTVIFY